MKSAEYRKRIYRNYCQKRTRSLLPNNIEELNPRGAYLRRLIERYFPQDRNASILDLGCGYGAVLYFARQAGYKHLRGIESSPEQLQAALDLGIQGIEEGDLRDAVARLDNESQDCVVTFDVIEHFTRDELIPIVDNINRVLKPGGCWIIHTPNGESPFGGRMRYWDLTHEMAYTRTSIGQLLLTAGFTTIRCYEDEPIPHGVKSAIRWLLWKIIRNILRIYIAIETGNLEKDGIFSQNFLTIGLK